MTAWWERAACKDTDPNDWFHEGTGGSSAAYKVMRRVCGQCPVQDQCLEEDPATELIGYRVGIRAGRSPDERDALARARHAAASTPLNNPIGDR